MVSLRITAYGRMRISSRPDSRGDKKKLTSSDQGDENCDDHEEYGNVFDNLRGSSIPHARGHGTNTHDGATLLPQFDVENGCMYLL